MKRWERWSFNCCIAVVAVTGFVYLWMKYFVENTDPFAVVNHPWQGAMLHAHLLAAPVMILVFGLVLNSHILKKLGATRLPNRRSGLLSLGLFAVMSVSGYLLQVFTSEQALQALMIAHVVSGALFSLAYGVHLVLSWQLGRSTTARSRMREVA
jgi:hypothetical protein